MRGKRGTKDAQDLVSELSGRDIKAEASLYLMVSPLLPRLLRSFSLSLSLSRRFPASRGRFHEGRCRDKGGKRGRREEEEATTRNYCIDPRADSRAPPTVEPILALSPSYASRFRPLSTKQSWRFRDYITRYISYHC